LPELLRAGEPASRALEAHAAGQLEVLVHELEPSWILNCVALSRMDACERDPQRAQELNAHFAERVARAARARGARLVHVSTDLVFDGEPPRAAGYSEQDAARPLSVYGRSKLAGEDAVLAADPRALVVRLPLLSGDSGGRGLGASDALRVALERGELPVLYEDEWRTPLEVSSAARALLELALGSERGRLHVAGPVRVSRYELGLLSLVADGLELDEARDCVRASTRVREGVAALRPRDLALDASRARALLRSPLPAPHEALGGA
jgi:dTDP-4-dehydrorhamnose reductase